MLKYMYTVVLACAAIGWADVRLPAILGDHMVLQQQSDITVWGWADPGERISVKASWQPAANSDTVADSGGNWKVTLRTAKAGGPVTLRIKGKNEIVLEDILIGEVWL